MTLVALLAGLLVGLTLGALGGGGSVLAVPVLVYLLDQTATQATTGSLLVVGSSSLIGVVTAHRAGNVLLARGVGFGLVALGGAGVGARATALVSDDVLLACFSLLLLVIGTLMAYREIRRRRTNSADQHPAGRPRPGLDEPIITFRPTFHCHWGRALTVLLVASAVGLLTGFLGVGGGFLVVPALVLTLGLPMRYAAGTSLVVMTMTSAVALAVRSGTGLQPDWGVVLMLAVGAAVGSFIGARVAARADTSHLATAFAVLLLSVAAYTATRALPALI